MQNDLKGTANFAAVMQDRMKQMGESAPILDFGSIDGDWCLVTNSFPVKIPRSGFQICRGLAIGKSGEDLGVVEGSEESARAAAGSVKVPERMRSLQPGDRVLVAWLQNEAVVIDIILPAVDAG